MIPRLEYLLQVNAKIRDCIARFATENDANAIFSGVLATISDLFHSTYAFLLRFTPDGGLVRTHASFRSPEYDQDYLTPQIRGDIARRFSLRDELLYRLEQKEEHDDDLDVLLSRARSSNGYFAAIHANGEVWGYLGILSDNEAPFAPDEDVLRRDIVNLLEIAVRRTILIAEIERKEKDLAAAAEEARQAARAKTMFLATMSHEIRTPLNAIIGFAEILGRSGNLSDEARECSDGITRSANALLDLLNDILDLSKIEAGATDVFQGECDLPALFRELATVFRYTALAKGIELRHSIPGDMPPLRLAGPRIRQILLNLIGNSVKFTNSGYIEWTASYAPNGPDAISLAIDVRDTGVGIPPDRIATVFDPFTVANSLHPDSRTKKSIGLGLLIVKRLVEACGGTVSVESALGTGSVFHIRINRVATLPRHSDAPRQTPAETSAEPVVGPSFLPLLVDDIDLNLHILALHLRSLGIHDTLQAESGEAALEIARQRRPSIVFTDLWMPGMDGAQLARAIRSDPALAGIPVVAVTADDDASASFDASVFDDILVKPLVTEKIADCLARLFPNPCPPSTPPPVPHPSSLATSHSPLATSH